MELKRSKERIVAGVCGGLGEYFNLDPAIVRISYALLSIFSAAFPGILIYLILWLVMPSSGNEQNRFDP